MDEGSLSIQYGALRASLGYWLSSGSWSSTRHTFTFRRDDRRFRLIGFDVHEFKWNSGETTELSINHLTGTM